MLPVGVFRHARRSWAVNNQARRENDISPESTPSHAKCLKTRTPSLRAAVSPAVPEPVEGSSAYHPGARAGRCVGWRCRRYEDLNAFAAFARSPPSRISAMSELPCQITLKINKINPPGTSARKANNAASEDNTTVLTIPAPNISACAVESADFNDCALV